MTLEGPRLTEERLRFHLDSNQVMRERLCLSLMPLIGPYTRERPRRPKGGPDGGRDIEAIREGSILTWGAVGFRNGGGNDTAARRDACSKFESDLLRSLEENPSLQAFVFFTNVDLTPVLVEQLREHAASQGVALIDIVDMERLRHALDSPEGLIARLQYLDIPMSSTEQIALVNKFGSQLQSAVASRFDRVERTLSQMERFLDFQKPIFRLDVFISLHGQHRSSAIGHDGILLRIEGLQDLSKSASFLMVNLPEHHSADTHLVTAPYAWLHENPNNVVPMGASLGLSASHITAYFELSLTTGGHRVRIADLTSISISVYVTEGLSPYVRSVFVDANGYELFGVSPHTCSPASDVVLPESLSRQVDDAKWHKVVDGIRRELLFSPPLPSGRFVPLQKIHR